MKKVSAATITQLSAATFGGAPLSLPPAPSVDDLLAKMRATDSLRAHEFNALLADLPQGFSLVPVLYTRVAKATNASLESEYLLSVRQRFLKFLGTTQQQALRDLGVCENGIARMARGLDPATVTGERYELSVDHIIERNGSGVLSDARAKDPSRNDAMAETYPVNHFGNLLLIQQELHDLKNRMNALQGIHELKEGQSAWVLMLAPQATENNPGYVAQRQPATAKLGQLRRYNPNAAQQIGETSALGGEAADLMDFLAQETAIGSILPMLERLARNARPAGTDRRIAKQGESQRKFDSAYLRRPFTVADLGVAQPGRVVVANNNHRRFGNDITHAPSTLRGIFNSAASHDRTAERAVTNALRPRLKELNEQLLKTYARVETLDIRNPGHRSYKDFIQFFQGRNLRMTCLEASRYPLAESRALLDTYRRIEKAIDRRLGGAKNAKSFKKTG